MKFTCLVCGKEIEQRTSMPKLYCNEACRKVQADKHIIPLEVVRQETERRKMLFRAAMPEEQQRRRELARKQREAFLLREAAIYAECDEPRPKRYCHNFHKKDKDGNPLCRNKTWDYYCADCRRKMRSDNGLDIARIDTESMWDGF